MTSTDEVILRAIGLKPGNCDIIIHDSAGESISIDITTQGNIPLEMVLGEPHTLQSRGGTFITSLQAANSRDEGGFDKLQITQQSNNWDLIPDHASPFSFTMRANIDVPFEDYTKHMFFDVTVLDQAPEPTQETTTQETFSLTTTHKKINLFVGELAELEAIGGDETYTFMNPEETVSMSLEDGQADELHITTTEPGSITIASDETTPGKVNLLGLSAGTTTLQVVDGNGETKNVEVTVTPEPIEI